MKLPDWRSRDLRVFHQCEGKHAYDSPKAAQKGIKALKRNRRSMDGSVHAYRCNICKKWHVGQVHTKIKWPKIERRRKGEMPG